MSTMIPLSLLISLDDDGTTKIFLQWHTTRIWGKGNKRKAQENKNYRQFFIDFPTRRHDDVHFYWIMKQRRKKVMSWWWERERWFKRGKKGAMMNADFSASSYFIPFSTMIFSTSFIILLFYMHNFHFATHFSFIIS